MGSNTPRYTLDNARDFLHVTTRAVERWLVEAKAFSEDLQCRQPDQEWLEETAHILNKAVLTLQQQADSVKAESERLNEYVESVKQAASDLALRELRVQNGEEPEKTEDARFIHPELHRYKLEKQAKIIGKYGGSPAFGLAGAMQAPPRNVHLKATVSPASREIQYSKVEGKDAQYLAQVMQFKKEKAEAGLSQWQEEVVGKKGREFVEKPEDKEEGGSKSGALQSPCAQELAAKLASRQATLQAAAEAEAEEAAARRRREAASAGTPGSGTPSGELAERLAKRAAAAAAAEAEAAAAQAEAEGSATPAPSLLEPPAPGTFRAELTERIAKRAAATAHGQQAGSSSSPPAGTPGPRGGGGGSPPGDGSPSTPAGFSFPALRPVGAAGGTPGMATGNGSRVTPGMGSAASELQERFNRLREKEGAQDQ